MAAPMASHVRTKIYFVNKKKYQPTWMMIERSVGKNIADVKTLICDKFMRHKREIKLFLQECELPNWESTMILEKDDRIDVECVHIY